MARLRTKLGTKKAMAVGAMMTAAAVVGPLAGTSFATSDLYCNQQVCFRTFNTHTHITAFEAYYTGTSASWKGNAWVFINGVVTFKSPTMNPGTYDATFAYNVTVPSGAQFCIELHGIGYGNKPGHPCINIT